MINSRRDRSQHHFLFRCSRGGRFCRTTTQVFARRMAYSRTFRLFAYLDLSQLAHCPNNLEF